MRLVPIVALTLASTAAGQTFSGDVTEIPYSLGGTQQLFVTAGGSFANQTYFVAGTTSGTSPGFAVAGFPVPLNPDFYFNFTVANPNSPYLMNSFGQLDASGWAKADFTLPAFLDPTLVGVTVSHSYLVLDSATFAVLGASPAVNCLIVSGPVPNTLVINEFDYDQGGEPDFGDFIEILNVSTSPVDLNNIRIDLIDGATGLPYNSFNLAGLGMLQPDQYLVLADNPITVPPTAIKVVVPGNFLENGPAEGIQIVHTSTFQVLDAVGYAGTSPVSEGTSDLLFDVSTLTTAAFARCPDGDDTGDNDADFQLFKIITPGEDNVCP